MIQSHRAAPLIAACFSNWWDARTYARIHIRIRSTLINIITQVFAAAGIYIMEMSRGRAMKTLDKALGRANPEQNTHAFHTRCMHDRRRRWRQARIGWQIYKYHLFNFRFSSFSADANTIELVARSARQCECIIEIQLYAVLFCEWCTDRFACRARCFFAKPFQSCTHIRKWHSRNEDANSAKWKQNDVIMSSKRGNEKIFISSFFCYIAPHRIMLAPNFTEAQIQKTVNKIAHDCVMGFVAMDACICVYHSRNLCLISGRQKTKRQIGSLIHETKKELDQRRKKQQPAHGWGSHSLKTISFNKPANNE